MHNAPPLVELQAIGVRAERVLSAPITIISLLAPKELLHLYTHLDEFGVDRSIKPLFWAGARCVEAVDCVSIRRERSVGAVDCLGYRYVGMQQTDRKGGRCPAGVK